MKVLTEALGNLQLRSRWLGKILFFATLVALLESPAHASSIPLVNLVINPAFSEGGVSSRGTIGVQANAQGELQGLEIQAFGKSRPISLDQLRNGVPMWEQSQGGKLVLTALPSFDSAQGGFVRLAYSAQDGNMLSGRSALVQIVRDENSGHWIMQRLHEDGVQRMVTGLALETSGNAVRNLLWEVDSQEAPSLNPADVLRRISTSSSSQNSQLTDRRAKGSLDVSSEPAEVIRVPGARPASAQGSAAI